MIKQENPAVIIISNYSPEQVYHKALEKDPTALDSLLTRLTVVRVTEPLDIDGFREALAQATLATTATPTTSEVVEASNVPTSARAVELVADNSTTEIVDLTTESPISTPPQTPTESMTSSTQTPPTTPPQYQINEDELIEEGTISVADGKREETPYERFMRERREKIRKQQRQEDAFSRLERGKHNTTLFTGYN